MMRSCTKPFLKSALFIYKHFPYEVFQILVVAPGVIDIHRSCVYSNLGFRYTAKG